MDYLYGHLIDWLLLGSMIVLIVYGIWRDRRDKYAAHIERRMSGW